MAVASPPKRKAPERKRPRISVTVPAWLLDHVDRYLEEQPESDRSAVVSEALRMWYAERLKNQIRDGIIANREMVDPEEAAYWEALRRYNWELKLRNWK